MADTYEFKLKLLALYEDERWVVLDVDRYIASIANTLDEARESFSRIFAAHVHQDLIENLEPLSTVPLREETEMRRRFDRAPPVGEKPLDLKDATDRRYVQELRLA